MVHVDGPVGLDGVGVCFDDQRAVADAGIVLAATLADRLGIDAWIHFYRTERPHQSLGYLTPTEYRSAELDSTCALTRLRALPAPG